MSCFYCFTGILKAGESRLGKIVKEKIVNTLGSKKAQGINVVLKDSSYRYKNGISMYSALLLFQKKNIKKKENFSEVCEYSL